MVSFYITYSTSAPKRKRALTPIKYDFVAYVTTIEIKETDSILHRKMEKCFRIGRNVKRRKKELSVIESIAT